MAEPMQQPMVTAPRFEPGASPVPWQLSAWWRRTLFIGVVLTQTLVGAWTMLSILPYHGNGLLELSLLGIYAVLFGWISAGMWMAISGFAVRALGGDPRSLLQRHRHRLARTRLAPTAVVMPIYHENVERALRGLGATYHSLVQTGQLEHFQFFILSDSQDPECWLAEQASWQQLCRELDAHGRIHYRRRRVNLKTKTGNVGDFLRRWGRRFRYFVVLDADSLMSGETLIGMVRLMECEPALRHPANRPHTDQRALAVRPPAAVLQPSLRSHIHCRASGSATR